MKLLNRSVAVVRPKKAFFRWLQSLSLGAPLELAPEEADHGTVYLLPPFVDEEDEQLLLEYFHEIFHRELAPFLPEPEARRPPDPDPSTFRR